MTRIEPEGFDVAAAHYSLQERLPMWVLYSTPTDYPESCVARLWVSLPTPAPTTVAIVAPTAEEVRAQLPAGLVRLERRPEDEPQISEVWL